MHSATAKPQAEMKCPPIRVLHYFAFPGGGIGRYVHELLSRMHTVPDLAVELACVPSYHFLGNAPYPVWPGLRDITHPNPLRRRIRFAVNLVVNPLRAIARAQATGAHILHLSTIPHVTFAFWRRRLDRTGIKLVATAHDVRRSQGLISLRYELEQLRRLYRRCEALFVHSEFQKKDLIDFAGVCPERVYVVPHGPCYHGPPQADKETLRRRYGVPLDKQVALFFGDIRPDKNLDLFLRAMVPFKDRLFLVVAGQMRHRDGKDGNYYKKLAAELGLEGTVLWRLEYIPNDEVPNYFEMCDWVAMPYSGRFTSQSGVLNVAMAHHRPVLISGTPTVTAALRGYDVGVVIPPDNFHELYLGISEIYGRIQNENRWEFHQFLMANAWETNVQTADEAYRRVALMSV
jgi:glycosyltransferase involved in cell wall biosynthesis